MSRILVVGGSLPGIGQAITNRFISNGEQVVGTYLTSSNSDEERTFRESAQNVEWTALSAETSGGLLEICQIPDVSSVVVAEFFFYMENPAQFDVSKWDLSLAVNLTLPKIVGHAALNNWPDCKSVVFVTSSEANTGSFGAHSYAATKAATHNLVKSLANVGGPNCRFNAVAAGWIGGVMDTDEVFNMSRRVTPLGRLGSPEEIAAAAGWLISEEASFVNGTTLYVDGGYTGVDTISKYEFENEFGSMSSSD